MTPDARGNVVSLLEEAAGRAPDRPALFEEAPAGAPLSITFGGLRDRAARIAGGLLREGFAPGDRAVLMIPMSIDLYTALLGVLRAGGVAVFVDPWIPARSIAAFAALAEPRAFIGIPKSHLLRALHPDLRRIPIAVTTGRRFGPFPAARTLREIERGAAPAPIRPRAPDDPALVSFTTGSSGDPKGVNRTHGTLGAQREALVREFPFRADDVDLAMFPVFALNNLAAGVPTVIPAMDLRRPAAADPARLLRQMERHGVTTCTLSPPVLDRLVAFLEGSPGRRPRLRRIVTGGAPIEDRALRAWRAAFPGAGIALAYGSTEAEPVARVAAEERLAAAPGPGLLAGRPVEGIRVRIVRIERGPLCWPPGGWADLEAPPGAIGEILVSGPHVCRGYFRSPSAFVDNKVEEPGGAIWHRMGDTGSLDPEGRLWLAGRVHSTILRAGAPVHPLLVERAAQGDDAAIGRAAAVGLPDEALGERVAVVLEASDRGAAGRAADRLRSAGLPADEVAISDSPLPLDPRHNAKTDSAALRARLLARRGGAPLAPSDPFPRRLRAYLRERFPLFGHGLLIASYSSSNMFLARTLEGGAGPMRYDAGSLLGAVALLGFFFHLRVFDEHKDYGEDLRHHPGRVLQRGIVTLRELRLLGGVAIGVEILLAAIRGEGALCGLLGALAFSLLMLKEFFAGEWLRRRFLLYAVSHMLVMPLLALALYSFATRRFPWEAPGWFHLYAWVGFFVAFNWEISRKIRPPGGEVEGLDSWSRIFGPFGATALVLAMRVIDTGLVALVGVRLGLSPAFYAALGLLFLATAWGAIDFRLRPAEATARRLAAYAGMYIIAFDLLLAAELMRKHGLAFGGP